MSIKLGLKFEVDVRWWSLMITFDLRLSDTRGNVEISLKSCFNTFVCLNEENTEHVASLASSKYLLTRTTLELFPFSSFISFCVGLWRSVEDFHLS